MSSQHSTSGGDYLRIVLTPGEPAGIGPDIALAMAQQQLNAEIVVVADPAILLSRARDLNLSIDLEQCDLQASPSRHKPASLKVIPINLDQKVNKGELNTANAHYVISTLKTACRICRSGQADALVTGPVHKGLINQAGIRFTGHTEFLAEQTQAGQVVMMLASHDFRVALVTTHLPLSAVSPAITPARLTATIEVLEYGLRSQFGITDPRIIVCGLNPHAGEDGHLGREEQDIIRPVLKQLRERGIQLIGPLPADTAFTPHQLNQADAVLAMYHDQGLPVIKHRHFGAIANITLGLPIIRTSVDHGTALSLAGTGHASAASLMMAIKTALSMVRHTHASTGITDHE